MRGKSIITVLALVVAAAALSSLAFGGRVFRLAAPAHPVALQGDAPKPYSVKTVSRVRSLEVVESHSEKDERSGELTAFFTLRNVSKRAVVSVGLDSNVRPGVTAHWVKTNVNHDGSEAEPLIPVGESRTLYVSYSGGTGALEVVSALFDDGSDDSASDEAGERNRAAHKKARERGDAPEGVQNR